MSAEKAKPQEAAKASPPPPAAELSVSGVFDVVKIRSLVELMKEFDLNQMELRQGEARIDCAAAARRWWAPQGPCGRWKPRPAAAPAKPAVPAAPPPRRGAHRAGPQPHGGHVLLRGRSGVAALREGGRSRRAETTVCIVEAMKVFNEIPAEDVGQDRGRAGPKRRAGGVQSAVVQGRHPGLADAAAYHVQAN